MRKLRLAGVASPLIAATVLLAATPASASWYGWSSCDRNGCDYAQVDGNWALIQDSSDDQVGAALDIRFASGGSSWLDIPSAPASSSHTFSDRISAARICDWAERLQNCGGWKYF